MNITTTEAVRTQLQTQYGGRRPGNNNAEFPGDNVVRERTELRDACIAMLAAVLCIAILFGIGTIVYFATYGAVCRQTLSIYPVDSFELGPFIR